MPQMLTANNRGVTMFVGEVYEKKKIESKECIKTFLAQLAYALLSGNARINFQKKRVVDDNRDEKYTNRFTMHKLFPNEDEVEVLKRELASLKYQDYIETVRDTRYPERSDMRVFGKKYSNEDVYIKIRVELLNAGGPGGDNYILVMSFHFAEVKFVAANFPYR